jgi:hypothetical protein
MTTTNTLPRPLMGHYVALALEALEHHNLTPAALLQGLEAGTLALAWSGPALPPPSYCKAGGQIDTDTPAGDWASRLVNALARQAGRYAYDGLDISQADCWWLIAKIRAGALQLVTADTLAALRRAADLVEA